MRKTHPQARRLDRVGIERPVAIPLICLAIWVLTVSATGCMTVPANEIKYFSQAFNTVNSVGQSLLDDLAVAERTQGKQIAVRRAKGNSTQGVQECPPEEFPWLEAADLNQGIIRGFCLQDAAYFSVLSDPPATAVIRGTLSVIERYADILSTLAEGRDIEGAIGQIDALGMNVVGLVGLAGVANPVGSALAALRPILQGAARQANATEAKRLILEGAPKVSAVIAALRQASPSIFKTLIEATAVKLTSEADATPAVAAADVAHVEAYRTAVANYVVLLGKLQTAWDLTIAAANTPRSKGDLSMLVQQTAELKGDAEAARRVFTILRAGGTATQAK
jgi:hypothetical protein